MAFRKGASDAHATSIKFTVRETTCNTFGSCLGTVLRQQELVLFRCILFLCKRNVLTLRNDAGFSLKKTQFVIQTDAEECFFRGYDRFSERSAAAFGNNGGHVQGKMKVLFLSLFGPVMCHKAIFGHNARQRITFRFTFF